MFGIAMDEQKFEKYAEIFAALANKSRLQILAGLIRNECNVSEIVESLGLPQSTISQHLAILRNKGIIKGIRHGRMMCYRVVDDLVRVVMLVIMRQS